MSQVSLKTSGNNLQPLTDIQVGSDQVGGKDKLEVSGESPKKLSSESGHSLEEPSSSSQNVSQLSPRKDPVPSMVRRDSSSSSLVRSDSESSLQHDDALAGTVRRHSDATLHRQDSVSNLHPSGSNIDLPELPDYDPDDDQVSVQRRDSQDGLQDVQGQKPKVSDEASTRLKGTIAKRMAKQKKLDENPKEARKDFKSRFDKFLKEFKSVVKNVGKFGKAVGDTGKGVREAVISGDKAKLGGFDSDGAKIANDNLIKADGMAGTLKDASTGLTVVGGVLQFVETASDIYLFKGKVDKAKVDSQTMKDFAGVVKELEDAKGELNGLMTDKVKGLNDAIKLSRDAGLDPTTIQSLEQELRDALGDAGGTVDRFNELQKQVTDLTKHVNDTFVSFRLAKDDWQKFHDDFALEWSKLTKSSLDGIKAGIDIARLGVVSGTVAAEGLKVASGTVGAIVGPITFGVNIKDMATDIDANRAALRLKKDATAALKGGKIDKQDVELVSIASRIRLKQKKQSVDKGLSATKNAFGAASGIASGLAGAATIAAVATSAAVGVAAICTPIGWAFAGAAALAAVGYGIYKLARHINSKGIKDALQGSIQTLDNKKDDTTLGDLRSAGGLSKKQTEQLDRVAKKAVAALKSQGIDKKPEELTLGELRDYAMTKLLARDTGVATASLYSRFKEEVAEHFAPRTLDKVSKAEMDTYLKQEAGKDPATSAMGLMSKLSIGLSPEDALMLARTGDKGESSAIKFLSKKLKLT